MEFDTIIGQVVYFYDRRPGEVILGQDICREYHGCFEMKVSRSCDQSFLIGYRPWLPQKILLRVPCSRVFVDRGEFLLRGNGLPRGWAAYINKWYPVGYGPLADAALPANFRVGADNGVTCEIIT